MKKVLGLIALLLFVTGCASNVKNGVSLLEDKKYEEAVTVFQKDVEKKRNLD